MRQLEMNTPAVPWKRLFVVPQSPPKYHNKSVFLFTAVGPSGPVNISESFIFLHIIPASVSSTAHSLTLTHYVLFLVLVIHRAAVSIFFDAWRSVWSHDKKTSIFTRTVQVNQQDLRLHPVIYCCQPHSTRDKH